MYALPTPLASAMDRVEARLESPSLTLRTEPEGYWPVLNTLMQDRWIVGPPVYDARVAALCRLHGVRELWTADPDFG